MNAPGHPLGWLLLLGAGCDGEKGAAPGDTGAAPVDADGDGYPVGEDCDDANATVHPGAEEIWYDGVDQDCDGADDYDADGDGYTSDAYGGEDCDDTDPGVALNEMDTIAIGIGPDCADMVVGARRYGEQEDDGAVGSAAAGDVNADGYDDVLFGTSLWENEDGATVGAAYLVLGPVAGDQSLATADARIEGTVDYTYVGTSSDGLGDADGDGYDDLVFSRTLALSPDVAAWVFLGPVTGRMAVDAADGAWFRDPHTYAGNFEHAGDTDGDGLPDMLFRVNHEYLGANGVHLVLGPLAGEHTLGEATAAMLDEYGGDLGRAAGVKDTNGDGFDDIAVAGSYAGAALFLGPLTGDVPISEGDAIFPAYDTFVEGGGDLNGDGYADVLVSTANSIDYVEDIRGAVFVFQGPLTGVRDPYTSADATALGEGPYDRAIGMAGDVDLDGDNLDDLLVSSTGSDSVIYMGGIYVLLSPLSGTIDLGSAWWTIAADGERSSLRLQAGVGDANRDGYEDVVTMEASASIESPSDGAFYLLYGGS